MNIIRQPQMVGVDFERPEAPWVLLVVDDRWDHVKRMIVGNEATEPSENGMGLECIDPEKVDAYWEKRRTKQSEPFVRSLLFLPFVVLQDPTIAKIAFVSFPPKFNSRVALELLAKPQRLAALIDVIDTSVSEEAPAFLDVWRELNASGVSPSSARALLTRGGALHRLPAWCRSLSAVSKQPEEYGVQRFQAEVHRWWKTVLGDLRTSSELFQVETRGKATHSADTLDTVPIGDVLAVQQLMVKHDPFGVWRWCDVTARAVDISLKRKWLAAKSFQTFPPDSTTIPTAGLIALVNGLSCMRPDAPYAVNDFLARITSTDIKEGRSGCVGNTYLDHGVFETFAIALRDWLLHPEQHTGDHAQVVRVAITAQGGVANLAIRYTKPLPDEILLGGVRQGSARRALVALTGFAQSCRWDHAKHTLTLTFKHDT